MIWKIILAFISLFYEGYNLLMETIARIGDKIKYLIMRDVRLVQLALALNIILGTIDYLLYKANVCIFID